MTSALLVITIICVAMLCTLALFACLARRNGDD